MVPSDSKLIDKLPNELFIRIVVLARDARLSRLSKSDDGAQHDGMNWLIQFPGVSTLWRERIVGTPLLWSSIDLSRKKEFILICLARSQNALLTIYLPELTDTLPVDMLDKASCLVSHAARVSNVDIRRPLCEDLSPILAAIITSPLPRLLSLSLAAASQHAVQSIIRHSPAIQNLSLSKYSFDVTGFLGLDCLKTLKLEYTSFQNHHRLSTLLDVLEACKSLQYFSWKGASPFYRRDSDIEHQLQVVLLPHIKVLHFSSGELDVLQLVTHVTLPSMAQLGLGKSGQCDLEEDFMLLPARQESQSPIIEGIRHLLVLHDESDESFTVCADSKCSEFWEAQPWRARTFKCPQADETANGAYTVCISYDFADQLHDEFRFHHALLRLGDCFPPTLHSLAICGVPDQNQVLTETDAWGHILGVFPTVTHIDVIAAESTDLWSFPIALQAPYGPPLPCQGLQELYLRFDANNMFEYMGMMGSTFEEVVTALQMRNNKGCARLRVLTIALEPSDDWVLDPGSSAKLPEHLDNIEESLEALVDVFMVELPVDNNVVDSDEEQESEQEDNGDGDNDDEDGSDEDGSDEEGSDEDGSDEEGSDEDGSDEEGSNEEGSNEEGSNEEEELE
ncbi:hypothetical protein C8Q72DRAFT_952272 [Fomitopsis betulina]|nr:hypothetical protein C8Q72DRAFT_952272 [Fomitopsis betulina]